MPYLRLSKLMNSRDLTWVLQSNAIGEDDLSSLTESILRLGHKVEHLRVIPFIHEAADPVPKIAGPCIVYGSSGLLKLGHSKNWEPCGWDGETFELDAIIDALGQTALNFGAVKTVWSRTFEAAEENGWGKVFVRPVSETKEFPGQVFELDHLRAWVRSLQASGYFENNNNPAMVGPALALGREWRLFIVDGQQISGCEYANRGIPGSRDSLPREVADFVDKSLQLYSPAPCFVVDVAEVFANDTNCLKVVEYNSINSAGFYACNKAAVVEALSQFALSKIGN